MRRVSLREKERMREIVRENKEVWESTRGEEKPKEQFTFKLCFDPKATEEAKTQWDYLKSFETTLAYHADVVSPNVKFSYGLPRQTEDGRSESFTDPSPGCVTRSKLKLLRDWNESRREVYEHNLMYKPVKFMPEIKNIDFEEKARPTSGPLKEIFDQFEEDEGNEVEAINKSNLNLAATAMKHYNLTHDVEYVIEEVLGSKCKLVGIKNWYHCNFLAKPKDGTGTECCSLFFAEIRGYAGFETTCCCILDGSTLVRGCLFCGEEFAHPPQGFTVGHARLLKQHLEDHEAVYIEDEARRSVFNCWL